MPLECQIIQLIFNGRIVTMPKLCLEKVLVSPDTYINDIIEAEQET